LEANVARDSYRIVDPDPPYFLTCTVVAWLAVFTRPATVNILLDSLRFLQEHQRITVFGYVVLENHVKTSW
jgi:hypothetical protein